jgi:RimJ/RimL family protein N-acetyltransferase
MKNKLLFTIKEFKKTAYHHYGHNILSIFKFIYYSGLRINTFIIYEKDLNEELLSHNLDPDFKVITPTEEELETFRKGLDLTREFYYDKVHGVKKCYLVFCKNEIAYIHWIYRKGDPNRFLILGDGVAELNYNTTVPKFRGRGLMAKMILYIFHDLKKQGYKKAVGVIHENNIPGVKSAERAGWCEIGRIKTIGPFNRKIKV